MFPNVEAWTDQQVLSEVASWFPGKRPGDLDFGEKDETASVALTLDNRGMGHGSVLLDEDWTSLGVEGLWLMSIATYHEKIWFHTSNVILRFINSR